MKRITVKLSRLAALALVLSLPSFTAAQTVYRGGKAPGWTGEELRVIMIGAHPDDAEVKGAGTAVLWAKAGAKVQLVAVANGDAGHQSEGGGALARRRAAESRRSAEILGVSWRTLGFHDGELEPTLEAREAVIRAIREWQADIVITHRPNDYHPDHRYTGVIVQDAAYLVAVPNICPETPRVEHNPVFMYFRDGFQKPNPLSVDVAVDVDPVMDLKWRSIDAMDSQMYEWLPWIAGYLSEVPAGKAARFEWLKGWRGPGMRSWTDQGRETLVARYGKAHADKVEYAEIYELCEYGRQPSREELWELFPK
ncbi:MAG: PIG-L family deacetylase [Candidatus Glassbacteria bacterium]|nr:PIG-L family deacetylase [Candidatus Glassbacteria bacterium]